MITSRNNPKIKELAALQKRRNREKEKLFLIEGYKELQHAINAGIEVNEVFYCPEFYKDQEQQAFINSIKNKGISLQEVSNTVFQKISYRENPDGLLGVAKIYTNDLTQLKLSQHPLILVLENLEKPGNLGAMVRTAEAAGVDAILLTGQEIDIFNPNAIRSSRGSIFDIPIYNTTSEHLLSFLQKYNILALATTPHTKKYYWDIDMTGGTAIFIGNEKNGLSHFWLKRDDVAKVTIPMNGKIDSLNASVSASLVIYEALRQRK